MRVRQGCPGADLISVQSCRSSGGPTQCDEERQGPLVPQRELAPICRLELPAVPALLLAIRLEQLELVLILDPLSALHPCARFAGGCAGCGASRGAGLGLERSRTGEGGGHGRWGEHGRKRTNTTVKAQFAWPRRQRDLLPGSPALPAHQIPDPVLPPRAGIVSLNNFLSKLATDSFLASSLIDRRSGVTENLERYHCKLRIINAEIRLGSRLHQQRLTRVVRRRMR